MKKKNDFKSEIGSGLSSAAGAAVGVIVGDLVASEVVAANVEYVNDDPNEQEVAETLCIPEENVAIVVPEENVQIVDSEIANSPLEMIQVDEMGEIVEDYTLAINDDYVNDANVDEYMA